MKSLQAAMLLSKLEGIIPALETAHAISVIDRIGAKKKDVVVVNLSGRGDKDLDTYIRELNL